MANYRKLGRKSDVRNAMLRSQATALLAKGKIITTEARAKELRKYVEPLIALAVREKDNFETVTVTAKVPKKDANGKYLVDDETKVKNNKEMRDALKDTWLGTYYYYYFCENNNPNQVQKPKGDGVN